MTIRSKLALAVLVAAVSLMAAASGAAGRRLELSEQRMRAVWPAAELATFIESVLGHFIECKMTIEGSFHSRTLSKVSGQLIGYITAAAIARPCNQPEIGEIYVLNGIERINNVATPNTLPWHVRFDSFTGALPRITGVRIQVIKASVLVLGTGAQCLYASTAASPLFAIFLLNAAGEVTGLQLDETRAIPLSVTLAGFCPGAATPSRTGNVTVQGATTAVRIRLVQ